MKRLGVLLLLALAICHAAHANLIGSQVHGLLNWGGVGGQNLFNPRFGGPPFPLYLNSAGPTVTIGGAIEFGFGIHNQNPLGGVPVLDANFGAQSLVIYNPNAIWPGPSNAAFHLVFTCAAFLSVNSVTVISSNYSGLSINLVGDTLTIDQGWVTLVQPLRAEFYFTTNEAGLFSVPPEFLRPMND